MYPKVIEHIDRRSTIKSIFENQTGTFKLIKIIVVRKTNGSRRTSTCIHWYSSVFETLGSLWK